MAVLKEREKEGRVEVGRGGGWWKKGRLGWSWVDEEDEEEVVVVVDREFSLGAVPSTDSFQCGPSTV